MSGQNFKVKKGLEVSSSISASVISASSHISASEIITPKISINSVELASNSIDNFLVTSSNFIFTNAYDQTSQIKFRDGVAAVDIPVFQIVGKPHLTNNSHSQILLDANVSASHDLIVGDRVIANYFTSSLNQIHFDSNVTASQVLLTSDLESKKQDFTIQLSSSTGDGGTLLVKGMPDNLIGGAPQGHNDLFRRPFLRLVTSQSHAATHDELSFLELTGSIKTIDGDVDTRNITASGDISSSGQVLSGTITASGGISASHFNANDTTSTLTVATASISDKLTVNGDIDLEGDIDVNGVANLDILDVDSTANFADNITIAGEKKLIFDSTATFIRGNTEATEDLELQAADDIRLMPADDVIIYKGGDKWADFDGSVRQLNISGSISASGIIYASRFEASGSGDEIDFVDSLDVTGNITASAGISAADLDISGNIDVDGITNLDDTNIDGSVGVTGLTTLANTDINGPTVLIDATTLSIDSTQTLNIDNSNTSNGITINTATENSVTKIGHTTSVTTINDELDVTGTVDIDDTTASTSTTTGALKVDGGVGIAKNLTVGTNITASNISASGNIKVDEIHPTTIKGFDTTYGNRTFLIDGNGTFGGMLTLYDGNDTAIEGDATTPPAYVSIIQGVNGYINTSKDFGINTTSPQATLHVSGNLLISGSADNPNGHITASNNISASGTVMGTNIMTITASLGDLFTNSGSLSASIASTSSSLGVATSSITNISSSLGHATASITDITASIGTIVSGNFSGTNISASEITASSILSIGEISASGFKGNFFEITSSTLITSESTQFGNSLDDVHDFSGSVNVLGNITASGTIVGTNFSGTNTGDVTLTGTPDYITISNQVITRNQIDLTTDVTGVLPSANLDSDTAHLTTDQTFSGNKTFTAPITASADINSSGNIFGTNLTADSQSFSTRITNLVTDSGSLSASISDLQDDSGSFSTRITNLVTDSGSFSTRITNLVTDSGSLSASISDLTDDSGSFSTRITNLVTDSGSLSASISDLQDDSGSFSTRITNLVTDSGSFSTRITNLVTDSGSLSASISDLQDDSGSFSTRITNLVTDSGSLSASISDLNDDSGSFSTRVSTNETNVTALQTDSGSFSTRVSTNETNISNLQTDSSSFSTRITTEETNVDNLQTDSGSFSTRITTEETNVDALQTDSGSFSTRVTGLETDSGSFSTRVSTNETNISNLQTDSGSFSTRVSTNETNISNLQTDSASFSTRISTEETNVDNLQTDSGSFSTRISTEETNVDNLQTDSGSFSTRVTTIEGNVGQALNTNSDVTFNSITATNITSSFITSSTIITSGSNIFGDEIGDTQTFNGNITASGNISASGNVIGNSIQGNSLVINQNQAAGNIGTFFGTGGNVVTTVNTAAGFILGGTSTLHSVASHGNLSVHGNVAATDITASGNISASGTITMLTASIGGGIFTSASLAGGGVSSYNDLTNIPSGIISSSEHIFTNITASGNISASGVISASSIKLDTVLSSGIDTNLNVLNTAGQTGLSLSLNTANGRLTGLSHNLDTDSNVQFNNITASNNISASGTIVASRIRALGSEIDLRNGHITASGDISSSGDQYNSILYNAHGAIINNAESSGLFQVKGSTDTSLISANNSGNNKVGIGTSIPTDKLTVSGSISASEDLSIGGNATIHGHIKAQSVISASKFVPKDATGDIGTSSKRISNLYMSSKIDFNDGSTNALILDGGITGVIRTVAKKTVFAGNDSLSVVDTNTSPFFNINPDRISNRIPIFRVGQGSRPIFDVTTGGSIDYTGGHNGGQSLPGYASSVSPDRYGQPEIKANVRIFDYNFESPPSGGVWIDFVSVSSGSDGITSGSAGVIGMFANKPTLALGTNTPSASLHISSSISGSHTDIVRIQNDIGVPVFKIKPDRLILRNSGSSEFETTMSVDSNSNLVINDTIKINHKEVIFKSGSAEVKSTVDATTGELKFEKSDGSYFALKGSDIETKDSSGNIKKEVYADGKKFTRSGSSTANQIEMQQNAQGAFISVSGSLPGYNIIKTGASNEFRLLRQTYDSFISDTGSFTTGIHNNAYNINSSAITVSTGAPTMFQVSASGDVFVSHSIHIQGDVTASNISASGTLTTSGVSVDGTLTATRKSFLIPHPTDEDKQLQYASLEGPENGVYIRGKLKGDNIIELPHYWTELIDKDSISVSLTPIGNFQYLYVRDISTKQIMVGINDNPTRRIYCHYVVYAERKDIDKLEVEI